MKDYSNDLVVLVIGGVLVGAMLLSGSNDWVGDLMKIGVGGLVGHLSAKPVQ